MKRKALSFALGLVLVSLSPYAAAERALGRVTSVGCHNTDNVCWVEIEGYNSSIQCNNNRQLRWDAGTTWGARWYATLLAAKATGDTVHLEVATYCGPQGYPTFVYGFLVD